jgi:small subunit ribosomal protein S20
MPNHKSAEKRVRQSQKRKLHNKYYAKSMRTAVKKLRNTTDKEQAREQLPRVFAMLDKLAKKNIIHKNKASNLKSKLTKHVNSLS